MIDRKEYLEACQHKRMVKWNDKELKAISYTLWFDNFGNPQHTANLSDGKSLYQIKLKEVEKC